MNTRSWIAFVMPMTLTGLHALSVETPTTVSTGRSSSRMARTMFSAPSMLVRTASYGKYSQVGTCLSAAALKTTSALRSARRDARVVAHVADARTCSRSLRVLDR